MEDKGYEDVITFVQAESNVLLTQLRNEAEVLKVSQQLLHWLDDIPLVWVPSQAFVAEAVPYKRNGYIVFSDGFLSLTDFTAEFSIVRTVLRRRQDLDRRTNEERELQNTQLQELYLRILTSQLQPERAVPLITFSADTPKFLHAGSLVVASFIRLFILLHEIGHSKLGHLRRKWFSLGRQTVRNELLLIEEPANQRKQEEHDADVFAIQQTNGRERQQLLNGAKYFFFFLSIWESSVVMRRNSHPHAGNRLKLLLEKYSTDLGDGKTDDDALEAIRKLHESWKSRGVSFSGGKLFEKTRQVVKADLPEEAVAVKLYSMIVSEILSDVKKRPDGYKNVLQIPD